MLTHTGAPTGLADARNPVDPDQGVRVTMTRSKPCTTHKNPRHVTR